ncbi:exonuclease DPD1, chloroplastic/mitochondrial isoform X2 [Phalaenopsis equestris]|uniref:exonuclease DPD1, chloroplastic/mitochondrial isoform X2 n=1 Tax=Phalaenopsis equestris TaxID=78828 RepID=UPI0009E65E34|nr:exonuclease DPD1, chloroplastic/mitochondrial isoform X2 [Phalaenopsis equestris]
MSFAPIWPGNFHQRRSYVGSNCSFRVLKSHAELFPGKQLEPRIYFLQPLATKIEGRNQWSHNTGACDISLRIPNGTAETLKNIINKKSDFHEYKPAQHCHIQKISEDKMYGRPATVLVFDTETTGLSKEWGRIIEIAIRDLIGGKNSTFQTLINPGRAVPNTDVHGISSGMVSRPGIPSFEELIPILRQFVSSRQRNGRPVLWIAHNGRRFDVPFLIREFNRCSVEIPEDWYFLDTLYLARQLRKPDGTIIYAIETNGAKVEQFGVK